MTGGLRQAMRWLHSWAGLVFGWLLMVIFVTGTLTCFARPITDWMRTDWRPAPSIAQSERFVAASLAHIAREAPDAERWNIYVPDDWLAWWDKDGTFHEARLDRITGKPKSAAQERETHGGYFFNGVHHSLYAGTPGILLVGLVTVAMLVALVSGIIIHKRLFKDLFTLRLGKGQRSWLDGHNVASVLSLPFQLMIAVTGLAIFHYAWMPAPIALNYGMAGGLQAEFAQESAYFKARNADPRTDALPDPVAIPLAAVPVLTADAHARTGVPLEWIYRERGPDGRPRLWIGMDGTGPQTLPQPVAVEFKAVGTPARLHQLHKGDGSAAETTLAVMDTLHEARFGGALIDWLWFLLGLIGCVMIATGLILFTRKRRASGRREFGSATGHVYRAIEAINVATVTGVTLASIAFLWASRVIPAATPGRAEIEVQSFFLVWAMAFVHALLRPGRAAWAEQCAAIALLCIALPLLNAATTGAWFGRYAATGNWAGFGVEIVAMLSGGAFALIAFRLARKAPA
ncbi:PepSY-associated TM helix domain-containing protein [Sphingomonas flavalba]|uniref:PepSY-associated TM helix domain-containing protein n=1 Tax=Sphingomonas flavalba TaxID=2559804 RepID=UPI0039DF9B7E